MANYLAITPEQLTQGQNRLEPGGTNEQPNLRGFNVYSLSSLMGITGRTKSGRYATVEYKRPLFDLTIAERIDMFRYSAPVFGIVTSRMHRVSGIEWNVVSDRKDEDRQATLMDTMKDVYDEFMEYAEAGSDQMRLVYRSAAVKIALELRRKLPSLLPDLSNFQTALMRWKRRSKLTTEDTSRHIEDWLENPNPNDSFQKIIKKWIFDLMIHGNFAGYLEPTEYNGRPALNNWYALPGGATFPITSERIGGAIQYVQLVNSGEANLYGPDELMFDTYVPTSFQEYGMVPLEALVNKIAESMLFDELSASQADGTKLPEKLLILAEDSPFGDLDAELGVPVNDKEQQKIETMVNEARQGAIRTITGVGKSVTEVDLTRKDTFPYYNQRQRQVREDMALVFNMSNMEVNLTGSAETSGRATSETEMQIDKERGLYPIIQQIAERINKQIIPMGRWEAGYNFQFKSGMSDEEEIKYLTAKLKSGLFAPNEIRTEDLGRDPFPEEQYQRPPGQQGEEQPGASEQNPLMAQLMG